MYTKITSPSVVAYDAATNTFLGEARFDLSPAAEEALLAWINYGSPIESFVVLNSDFEPSDEYVPIIPNQTYHQKGIFRALLTQEDTGVRVPVELRGSYDWRARSVEGGDFVRSAEYSNIKMDQLQKITY